MKKHLVFALLLLLCSVMLFGCSAIASAPQAPVAPDSTEPPVTLETLEQPAISIEPAVQPPVFTANADAFQQFDLTTPFQADLNNDGVPETITFSTSDDLWTTDVTVESNGVTLTDHSDTALNFAKGYIGDTIENDGFVELYFTGDCASDDYITFVYRLKENSLQKVELYGSVTAIDGNGIATVETVVDVLGTYGASCLYTLSSDDFAFTLCSPFTIIAFEGEGYDGAPALTVIREGLTATALLNDTETQQITLPVGTKLLLTETDRLSYALLSRENDTPVRLSITQNTEQWGWLIDGVAEEEWFGTLRYAG